MSKKANRATNPNMKDNRMNSNTRGGKKDYVPMFKGALIYLITELQKT